MNPNNPLKSAKARPISTATHNWLCARRLAVAVTLSTSALTGCYVMPVGQDSSGNTVYAYSPLTPAQGQSGAPGGAPASGPPVPHSLNVKLYPINDLANQTGVLTGQVTNMMTGKGRFTFNYQGETLVGEATRVENDKRRGIASAYGPSGVFARCDYEMSSSRIGAGTCTFSNNAMYQVHIGN
ncbi:MAG: hypothetical protein JSW48_17165 [Betaproteobacteria bacterium]|nr:MAG: hypothetical protein JSW48_17165 [Betaproteobacteria bacterium]